MKAAKGAILLIIILLGGGYMIIRITEPPQGVDATKTLTYILPGEPQYSYWTDDWYANIVWTGSINAGLLKRSAGNDRAYAVELAESMPTANADASVFTIRLKQNLVFSTGNPLTANDVVFSYKVLLTPSINKKSYTLASKYFASNNSILALDDYTVQFSLNKSYVFANKLFSLPIIAQDYYQVDYESCLAGSIEACDWNDVKYAKASAGAYTFKELVIDNDNQILTVVKNRNYWDADNIWAGRINFRFLWDRDTALSELETGKVDIVDYQYRILVDELSGVSGIVDKYVTNPAHSEMHINHLNPYYGTGESVPDSGEITDDAEQARLLRKAISHIIDREYIGVAYESGLSRPASSPMPQPAFGWREDLPVDEYNITLARKIMESIGFDYASLGESDSEGRYNNSFFEVVVLTPNSPHLRGQFPQMIAETLPKIGIGVSEYKNVVWSEIIPRTYGYGNGTLVPGYAEGGFDIMFANYASDLDWDPSGFYDEGGLADRGTRDKYYNYYNYINSTVSSKVQDYISEKDLNTRTELAGEIQEMLHHNLPVIPITYPQSSWVWRDELRDIDEVLLSISLLEWGNVKKTSWDEPAYAGSGDQNAYLQFPYSWVLGLCILLVPRWKIIDKNWNRVRF